MRTTLSIDDGLLATAKHRARQQACTLGQLVEESLKAYLSTEPGGRTTKPLSVFAGHLGVRPGIDFGDPKTANRLLHEDDVDDAMAHLA